jgi:hypothetical protein
MGDKRLRLIYLTIFLWLIFGGLGIFFVIPLSNLAIYYTSLCLFVGPYLFGESYRSSDDKTPIFSKGPTSKREIIIHVTVLLWFLLGLYGIFKKSDMNDLAAYFSVLSPYIGGYILAESVKKNALSNKVEETTDNVTEIVNDVKETINDIKEGNFKEVVNDVKEVVNDVKETINDSKQE